jgi:hypothetical protein
MDTHTTELLVLQDGRGFFYVPLPLYRRFRDAILIFMPDMIPKVPHKAEHLLGMEIWSTLDAGGRRVAGRCLAYMVRQGDIRLRRVGCKHEHPARYELDT